ncbi:30S ribosome-binding factor RbfA [bacterium]|nr:30S ribosome-binding factor RbfA [bacterium]MBU1651705.1 30S ribosome-binding factor RbfA [bacterium]MBU1881817.1 30S ribosome-binding factor RbfA [bacterium]
MSRRRWGDPLAKNPGRRQARINDLLRRAIGDILLFRFSEDLKAMTTVTEIRTSSDLRHARVYVAVLGDKDVQADTINILQQKRGEIRDYLAREVVLKYLPSVEFLIDESAEKAARIEELLNRNQDRSDEA